MNTPIHYILKAKLIKYKNEDIDFYEFSESFQSENPIDARIKAFKQYQNYIDVLLESKGKAYHSDRDARQQLQTFITPSKPAKLIIGGKEFEFCDSIGNGIGIYLVVDFPLNDNIDKKGDELLIHGIVDNYFSDDNPDHFLLCLEREYEYYVQLQLDTNGKERNIVFCNPDEWEEGYREEEPYTYKILETPFSWEGLDQPYWWGKTENKVVSQNIDQISVLKELIAKGESNKVEFKPSLLYNFSTQKAGIGIKALIAKTICAFLNSNGGILFIGINNNGTIQGLDHDFNLSEEKEQRDFFLLEYDQMLEHFLSFSIKGNVNGQFYDLDGKTIFTIIVTPSKRRPIFLNGQNGKEFYVRGEASSRQLNDIEEIANYCLDRFSQTGQE